MRSGSAVRTTSLAASAAATWIGSEDVTFIDDLNIAFIPPVIQTRNSAVSQMLSDDDQVAEVRPEIYLFKRQEFVDTETSTWGVAATQALDSPFTGKGIKICILDTGLDQTHQDFAGRTIVARSFTGEPVDDRQGHGTHCAGTAAGTSTIPGVLRYGVAPEADLFVGKVLNDRGFGAERDILAGIRWAIDNRCEVISMSLGSIVREGEKPSLVYERAGQLALDNGCLIVAAAGNESNRTFGNIAPVGSPANASTMLAVGAIDANFVIGWFSNGGLNGEGGGVDMVGPGVGVFSSSPSPQLYNTMSGTSMACPHVAGLAALWAESDPALRGRELWRKLTETARTLPLPKRDVGAGLAVAPQALLVAEAL